MARNQGGAQLSFLIVSLVGILVLCFVVFQQNSDMERVENNLAEARNQVAGKEDLIREKSIEISGLRVLIHGNDETAVPVPEIEAMIEKSGGDIATARGSSSSREYESLTEMYDDSIDTIRFLNNELQSQRSAAEAKDNEYQEVVTSKSNLGSQLNEEIDSLRSQLNDMQVQLEQSRTRAREESASLREEVERLVQDHSATVYKLQRDLSISQNLLQRSNDRIEELKREIVREQTFAMVDPDGEVLRVSEELGKAWINLGTKDRLRRGLVFDVFAYQKGGKRISKGRVEVLAVQDQFSEVAILENLDRFNPISTGDMIASPFYDKGEIPSFVFAGESATNGRYSLEDMSRKIELFGGVVSKQVELNTDFVVAVKGYEDSAQYDLARDLGVTILRETELLDFIDF
ncbi:MAG: BRCT domain-containing protein [Planctomycetota bacterium]|nr:BRCT domain-containing protein [Planctomycetota bacterium]